MSDNPVFNIRQAAEYTGRHPQTLRRAVRERELGCLRRGRTGRLFFRQSHLDTWLKGHEVRPARQVPA